MSNEQDFQAFVVGEPIIIRGAEREKTENVNGKPFTDIWLHVDFANNPEPDTTRINISQVKCEGGSTALYDHLSDRGLIPTWFSDNSEIPDTIDK